MDRLLLSIQILLCALGVIGVAAGEPSEMSGHLVRVAACLPITFIVSRIKPQAIVRMAPAAYVVLLVALLLVLFIGISPPGSDSRRWLDLGVFTFQPSELMKVAVIAYLASFFSRRPADTPVWRPTIMIGLACILVLFEPDIGTTAFIFLLALGTMLAGPVPLRKILAIGTFTLAAGVMAGTIFLSGYDYFQNRIAGFLDLIGSQSQTQSISYQAMQARNAIVNGGLVGIGPGSPVRVPEAETDMVAIAVTQSLGAVGILSVITLFVLLGIRGMKIASALEGPGSLLAIGATIYICGQAGVNLMVAAGLLPITGIPLPFMSYGLNSLVSVSVATGLIHSAWRQARLQQATA